jgi:hypothetical protein
VADTTSAVDGAFHSLVVAEETSDRCVLEAGALLPFESRHVAATVATAMPVSTVRQDRAGVVSVI